MKKIKNLETLENISKRKKNFIFIGFTIGIVAILLFSFLNTVLSVEKEKIYNQKNNKIEEGLNVATNPEYKEGWAISMENRIGKQEDRMNELIDLVKNQQNSVLTGLKNVINENNKKMESQLALLKDSNAYQTKQLKEQFDRQIKEQEERLSNLKELIINKIDSTSNTNRSDLIIGNDILPKKENKNNDFNFIIPADENKTKENIVDLNDTNNEVNQTINSKINLDINSTKNEGNITKNILLNDKNSSKVKEENIIKRVRLATVSIDTSFNDKIIKIQSKRKSDSSKEDKKTDKKSFHVSTGFMKAYMVTGAYAPAFEEGSMEPLPVLFEIEGKILMANDTLGSLDKCFLLGSAKGKMNSETADIKLVSMSCLADGGKYRIEGSISGWVIGENGNPGLQGEMIHKNGAWLARTFVSGFFSTFSQALSGSNVQPIQLGTTNGTTGANQTQGTSSAVSGNLLSAGATGISDVFSKLGDYYLKMAEQIFPIIEVKPGRTVSILLIGGEDIELKENKVIDMENMVKEANDAKKIKTVEISAFTKALTSQENNEVPSEDGLKEKNQNNNLEKKKTSKNSDFDFGGF